MTNLPPGVTDASLGRAYGFGGFTETWNGVLECDHSGAMADEEARLAGKPLGVTMDLSSAEMERLENAKTEFEGNEVDNLAVFGQGYGVTVQWDCPVCGRHFEDEHDAAGLTDDDY